MEYMEDKDCTGTVFAIRKDEKHLFPWIFDSENPPKAWPMSDLKEDVECARAANVVIKLLGEFE